MSTMRSELKLRITNSRIRIAALSGCFVFLFGCQSRGQDQLLKEYIYLDGRLLAVERLSVPAIARQPVIEEDKDPRLDFAANKMALPEITSRIGLYQTMKLLTGSVAPEICIKNGGMPVCVDAPAPTLNQGSSNPAQRNAASGRFQLIRDDELAGAAGTSNGGFDESR